MSVKLEDYVSCLDGVSEETRAVLEGTVHEAARVMSPAALETYMEGARGLCELGRGSDLVLSYLQEMPQVVKECGEDIIHDCINAALKLSSMTSGEVITLLFSTLPTAARRLGDPELLRGYLSLIHQLSAKASRGLRPMLNNLDELLSKLTLSGLRRWANFGVEAYRRDLNNLVKYFALETQDSRAMLQKERRGTLFVDTQRKLNFYLRALWGRDFFLRPAAADHEGFRPYIDHNVLHLPDAVDAPAGSTVTGVELYRAQCAHMAAHITATTEAMVAQSLAPAQLFFIGLLEDARVEYKAIQRFPGLADLWLRLMDAPREDAPRHESLPAIEQACRMLLDPGMVSDDAELQAITDRFHQQIAERQDDNGLSFDLGLELYNLFAARKAMPSLRLLETLRIPYRDDNRFIWEFSKEDWTPESIYLSPGERQVRRTVGLMEMVNELDNELAGDDAQEIWRLETPFYLDQEECTINELEGTEPISDPYHYPEWDYQVQLSRPDWVTLYERRQGRADPDTIDRILTDYKPVTFRIRQIIDKLQPQGVQRVRNLEDGDEIDINAAIDSMIDIRMGRQPNPRITYRNVIKRRDLSVVVLLDLSQSTNEALPGEPEAEEGGRTVLDLTREAASLVTTAIDGIGDNFAVHGFASDGRHDVQYYRFKDFGQPVNDEVRARLAGMRGGLSTRMGAALRHAGRHLRSQPERRKLILLITDGEPSDIDERDPQHLRHDTRKAVEELQTNGVQTYCLTLDPDADDYVKRIFGVTRYTVVDHVERLPEKLPSLFASLTS